jgi:hypothetical protein
MMLHFPLYYRLDAIDGYLIWHTDDVGSAPDTVETIETRFVASFPDLTTLLKFAVIKNIGDIVDDDPILCDIDAALIWAENPVPSTKNCQNALGVWNLFIDLCATLPDQFGRLTVEIDNALEIEQKLFYGSNLPSITPEGECYLPRWETDDKVLLQSVFSNGSTALQRSIKQPIMA